MTWHIGILIYPNLTQLDATGPFEIFSRLPGATVHLVAQTLAPVVADTGLILTPTVTFDDCPRLDLICVPGGPGQRAQEGGPLVDFLRARAPEVRYMTSVCTGALLLGEAGVLRGKRATTYWSQTHELARFGAIHAPGRVVRDGDVFTGGGVTAGLDFALTIAAELAGDLVAQTIQLGIEYDPAPPFDAGSPLRAPAASVEYLRTLGARAVR